MKKLISFIAIGLIVVPAMAAAPANRARRSMNTQMAAAPGVRSASNGGSTSSMASMSVTNSGINASPDVPTDQPGNNNQPTEPEKDMREQEKSACLANNIGIGNTFVWASRFSNVNNYSSMVEDIENPENNTCFVKVELKSNDARINVSDIPVKYFEMGQTITCGSWADEAMLKDRILKAKKTARTWGTVAGVVGGAGVGVGIMELFGNKLIGGKVEGQYSLEEEELLRSQLLVAKKDSPTQYRTFMDSMATFVRECEDAVWADATEEEKPAECKEVAKYKYLHSLDETAK